MIENSNMKKEMENRMKFDNNHKLNYKKSKQIVSVLRLKMVYLLMSSLLLVFLPLLVMAQQQAHFATADIAANNLYEIVLRRDPSSVKTLFGEENIHLLPFDKVGEADREFFLDGWEESHKLIPNKKGEIYIEIGHDGWTFPVPLLKNKDGWFFDTAIGAEVIQTRRIGRNELSTMQAVLAYYDAQEEYIEQDYNGDGVLEYAQKFISTPGKKDGLYWEHKSGEALSPLGSLFAGDTPEHAYHGYYYKILTAQKNAARGKAYSYLDGDHMKLGFALIAWPAEYGKSGIISFLINQDGMLYEKDMGTDTDQMAQKMTQYNPDTGWVRSEETPE